MRHVGIYVQDIDKLEKFYVEAFGMYVICSKAADANELLDELLDCNGSKIFTTKLVTEYGKQIGTGDMVELVKVQGSQAEAVQHTIYEPGTAHVAFGITDMEDTLQRILRLGGARKTRVRQMENGNKLCFCTDPEGNWIELIERGAK